MKIPPIQPIPDMRNDKRKRNVIRKMETLTEKYKHQDLEVAEIEGLGKDIIELMNNVNQVGELYV